MSNKGSEAKKEKKSEEDESLKARREELKALLQEGGIKTEPKFRSSNWPTDPLISAIRPTVAEGVNNFAETVTSLFDPQDLKYQTLFRLTTYSPKELFKEGEKIERYLADNEVYADWRNIPMLDANFFTDFKINERILSDTIEEQYSIIKNRLRSSPLPLEKIVHQTRISAEQGWYIQKDAGSLMAVSGRHNHDKSDAVRLEVLEVDLNYANTVFRDLHYIHTPRAKSAIGLFITGEEIPISVLGMSPVDRDYKKDVLLMMGYDPSKCWESVRLYSRPNPPMNTSSTMLRQAVKHLKETVPEIQACLSAFTPSFADGRSMIAGGFDNPVLAKPLTLKFGINSADSAVRWERLTKRRLEGYTGPVLTNNLPLLPTMELLRSIRRPESQSLLSPDEMVVSDSSAKVKVKCA